MNNYTLLGEEYSYLIPLLLSQNEDGYVHSRFSNGFNIKMGDSLVFIGNTKNGLLPFGIHLQEGDIFRAVSSVKNGEPVLWNSTTNSIEFSELVISLEKGKSFKNELMTLTSREIFNNRFERFCLQLKQIENRTGLDVSIDEFINRYEAAGEKNWHGVELYVMKLMEAAMSDDETLIEEALRYFLGRGQGLTPSGDDMIVGLLAVDAVSSFLSNSFYQKISQLIEVESVTTDVAKEYLRYALKQEYSSTISNMVNTLVGENTSNFDKVFHDLIGVGHSSGLDTAFGILIGMLVLKNKQ